MSPRLAPAAALAAALLAAAAQAAQPSAAPPAQGGGEAPAAAAAPLPKTPGTIKGGLAYTQPVRFDYDQDGTPNRVQFFVYFEGHTEAGVPGTASHRPAAGVVKYIVYDHDKKKKVEQWLVGFNMGFPEPGTPYPMTNLVIQGKTADFDAFNQHWTITDGGQGWQKDVVLQDDHFKGPVKGRFYDGDIVITPPR